MDVGRIPGVEKPVPRLILGSMPLCGMEAEEEAIALLDAAYELGWTAFDTAHLYGGGVGERRIGRWMSARGNRDEIVIVGKGAHHNADRKRVTPFDIASDLHDSLARLQTDYIDLYLLHRDNPALPVGPIVEALNEHLVEGRVRAVGGSNWTHRRIEEANEYADRHGLVPFVASSPNFSLAEQVQSPWGGDCLSIGGPSNADVRAWYERTGMAVLAWSSLARGFFSGRVRSDAPDAAGDVVEPACVRAFCHECNFERLRRVEKLAESRSVSVPQIALAFVMAQPMNTFALIGATNRAEMEDNLAGARLRLSPEELAWLDLGEAAPSGV